jgi:hypothetical protein
VGELVRVDSVDALKKFRAALCKFGETVSIGLDEAEADVQRTAQWLKHEQQAYWKRQVERRSELYMRAKSALNRKKLQTTALGGKASCVEEEKAVAAALRQLEEAKQKAANVHRWSRLFDEESFAHQSMVQGLSLAIGIEVPSALAHLDNMIEAIEAYASSTAPAEQRSVAPEAGQEAASRPEELVSMARAAPTAPGIAAEAYVRLRRRTPQAAIPANAAAAEAERLGSTTIQLDEAACAALRVLAVTRAPCNSEDQIVLTKGLTAGARIYLERTASAAPNDSGWYIGFADETRTTEVERLRIGDLLATSPELAAVLELPIGFLVVANGASLEAVLDEHDRLVWPPTEPEHQE